jgi:hypothetical protein
MQSFQAEIGNLRHLDLTNNHHPRQAAFITNDAIVPGSG